MSGQAARNLMSRLGALGRLGTLKSHFFQTLNEGILRWWVRPLDKVLARLMFGPQHPPQSWVRKGVELARNLGLLAMTRLRVHIELLEGSDWSVIYIGVDQTHSLQELRHTLFPEPAVVRHLGRSFLWRLPALINQFIAQGHLVVCDLNRCVPWQPRLDSVFMVPPWVRLGLDVTQPMEKIMARVHRKTRRNLRKVCERGFTYECSQRLADFDLFYHEMYLPYITARHQERAIVEPYQTKLNLFRQGGLILIKFGDQPVAGEVYRTIGDTCVAGSLGVYRGDSDLVYQGAIIALHWAIIDWAHRNRLRWVDFGMTRPRLQDGIFQFKLQWGMSISRDVLTHTRWVFLCHDLKPALVHFLNAQGFIAEVDGGYRRVVLTSNEVQPTHEEFLREEKTARKAGLDGLLVLKL